MEAWKYFFYRLRQAIPEVVLRTTVRISDRDKGLEKEVAELSHGNKSVHLHHCQHIKETPANA